MDKKQIFMVVTAFISIVCFNFNKITTYLINFICSNIYDDSVLTYGPYSKSIPIKVYAAYSDTALCTNKLKLFINWKWDFDIQGFNKSILTDVFGDSVRYISIIYFIKNQVKKGQYTCIIDLKNDTYNIVRDLSFDACEKKNILFDEIKIDTCHD